MAPLMPAIDWSTILAAIHAWVVAGSGLDAQHVIWDHRGAGRPQPPYISLLITAARGVGHDWERRSNNFVTFADLPIASVSPSLNQLAIAGHGRTTGDGPVRLKLGAGAVSPGGLNDTTDYWVIVPIVGGLPDPGNIQLAATFQATGGNYPGNPMTPIDITSAGSGSLSIIKQPTTVQAGKERIRKGQGIREVTLTIQCFAPEKSGIQAMQIMTDLEASLQLNLFDLDVAGFGTADLNAAYLEGGVRFVEGRVGSILEPRAVWTITAYVASEVQGFETIVEKASVHITESTTGLSTDVQVLPPQNT